MWRFWSIMACNLEVPDPNKQKQTPEVVRERRWCLVDSCQHIVDTRESRRHPHACPRAGTHPHTWMHTGTWHSCTHTHMQTDARTRKNTHTHTHRLAHVHTHANTPKQTRTHTHARTQTLTWRARTHTHAHGYTHDTCEGEDPPRVREPGKGADSGGWADDYHWQLTPLQIQRIQISCYYHAYCAFNKKNLGFRGGWFSFNFFLCLELRLSKPPRNVTDCNLLLKCGKPVESRV